MPVPLHPQPREFAGKRLVAACAVVAITILACLGLVRLRFDDSPHNVFRTDDEQFALLQQVNAEFGSDDNDCFLLVESADLFTPSALAGLRQVAHAAQRLAAVKSVSSLDDVVVFEKTPPLNMPRPKPLLPGAGAAPEQLQLAREAALRHPLAAGQLISRDGQAALVIVRLKGSVNSIAKIETAVNQLRAITDKTSSEHGLRIRMTGIPPVRVEIFNSVREENAKFTMLGASLSFLMAWLLFRRLRLVLIVSIGPVLGSLWTLGAMGWAGEAVNIINVVLPTLVIVVGLTNAIHLMGEMRRAMAAGATAPQAAMISVRNLWSACALAAGTTAVGFGSLAASRVDIVQRFGVVCAGGALLAFAAVILTAPLLASFLLRPEIDQARKSEFMRLTSIATRVVEWVLRRPRVVTLVGLAVTVALASSAWWLTPDSSLTETIPAGRESFQALARVDQAFGGALLATVLVEWEAPLVTQSPPVLSALQSVETAFEREKKTRNPLSVLGLVRSLPGAGDLEQRASWLPYVPQEITRRFVRDDLRRAIVTARLRDDGAASYAPVFRALKDELQNIQAQTPGVSLTLTGTPVVASRNINQMIVDLETSLALAAVVIFFVIAAAFRSLRMGLLSVPPNVFPLVVTSALLVIVGRPLQLASVIVFTICLGIAVDDTIHYLHRFHRERRHSCDVATALRRSSAAVGGALITSTLVLLVGFGCLIISEIPSSRLFAWLSCTAIAAALVGDLVLLPALLDWFGGGRKRSAET